MPGLVLVATATHGTTTLVRAAATLALLHLPVAGHGTVAEAGKAPTPVAAAITGVVGPVVAVRRAQAVVAVIPVGAVAVTVAVVEAIQAAAEAATSSVGAAVPMRMAAMFLAMVYYEG